MVDTFIKFLSLQKIVLIVLENYEFTAIVSFKVYELYNQFRSIINFVKSYLLFICLSMTSCSKCKVSIPRYETSIQCDTSKHILHTLIRNVATSEHHL